MEEQKDICGMLEMMLQPAFFVKEGIITLVNQAARQLLIEPDTPIHALLGENAEEYEAFEGGCLCLTLMLSGCPTQASVTRMDGSDLFVMDQSADQAELRAMALTAMGLREPLSDILAITEQLLPSIEQTGNRATQRKVSQMNRRLNQLHRIVCNMADAIQYSNTPPQRMVCQDICAVLEEVFDRIGELVSASGLCLTYSGPKEAIYCLIAAERLERAIYNIISNAMKHAPAGSSIEAKLTHRGNKLYLSIQDSGTGIPRHLLGSIYSRYRRQPGIEAQPAGLGLGMVLVRSTAAAHGGTVLIDQPGETGTRVTISLTIRKDSSGSLHSPVLNIDYAGERDHGLLELSDVLSAEFYDTK